MIGAILLLLAQSQSAPWLKSQADPFADLIPEKLGPGPHTLVISDGQGMTRADHKTGPACARARDSVRRQVAPPPDTPSRIYGASGVKAFCIPR